MSAGACHSHQDSVTGEDKTKNGGACNISTEVRRDGLAE